MTRRATARLSFAFAFALAFAATTARAQVTMSPSTPAMVGRLDRAGGGLPADHAVAVRFTGTVEVEAHLRRPKATATYGSSRVITFAAPDRVRQDWTTWSLEDTTRRNVESLLLVGERVLRRDDVGEPWIELAGRDAAEAAWPVWSSVPALTNARAASAHGRGLVAGVVGGVRVRYQWPETLGTVTLDLNTYDEPYSLELAGMDPRRGVTARDAHYFGTTAFDGRPFPDSVSVISYPTGSSWRSYERRRSYEVNVPLAALALPDTIQPAAVPGDTTPVVRLLAPHVWAIDLPDADTRSLVLEFASHLVVLETSCDVPHGERLHTAIREKVSKKPVRWVSFSHYHPDYTGGLRAFLADSARVVCAASNADMVDGIAHQPWVLAPDRMWRTRPGGFTPAIDTVRATRWRHADAINELVAIDIGPASQHTDSYLVFWLPRAKLLFEGDLGYAASGDTVRASRRAAGLIGALDAAKITPLSVTQGWPVKRMPLTLPMAKLRALAAPPPKR